MRWDAGIIPAMLASIMLAGCSPAIVGQIDDHGSPRLASLDELSIETLRARDYGSEIVLLEQIGNRSGGTAYSDAFGHSGSGPYETYMAAYELDGLRLYTRIDIPNAPPPPGGYPVIIFCHGWVGIDAAPEFHFSYTPESMYAELIDGYVDAGFVVLTPGYRGHGTVNDVTADGVEYMAAWDNASYLSPSYYAIDVLNLIEGLGSLETADWVAIGGETEEGFAIAADKVFLSGHSQGGDVVLTALAVAGEGSPVGTAIAGAAISDGTFADRTTQLAFYAAMQGTRRAFLSADGSWNGTASSADGKANVEFVFGYPPDWIETPQPDEWTWQSGEWPDLPVQQVVSGRVAEMYAILSAQVDDFDHPPAEVATRGSGLPEVLHDPQIARWLDAIGGYNRPQFLTEPLILHFSDQDYYSPPSWNEELCRRANAEGGDCQGFLYTANAHSMRASKSGWFSPPGTRDSYSTIIARDVEFFQGRDPHSIAFP